jgi:hypothetical protein
MDLPKVVVRLCAAALIFWCVWWILWDVLVWDHDLAYVAATSPHHLVGVVAGAILFFVGPRLTGPLSNLVRRLPLPRRQKEKPRPKWGKRKRQARRQPDQKVTREWHMPRISAPSKKIRIPGFRALKRWSAAVCMVLNFVIGEMSLTAPQGQPFAVFFIVNAFLLADYIWKTQRKPGAPE